MSDVKSIPSKCVLNVNDGLLGEIEMLIDGVSEVFLTEHPNPSKAGDQFPVSLDGTPMVKAVNLGVLAWRYKDAQSWFSFLDPVTQKITELIEFHTVDKDDSGS